MFEVNNRDTKAKRKICSNLTIKTPKRRQWRCSGVFIVNFEHISQLVLVFPLLTLSKLICSANQLTVFCMRGIFIVYKNSCTQLKFTCSKSTIETLKMV